MKIAPIPPETLPLVKVLDRPLRVYQVLRFTCASCWYAVPRAAALESDRGRSLRVDRMSHQRRSPVRPFASSSPTGGQVQGSGRRKPA
jgi:hypothetical protein